MDTLWTANIHQKGLYHIMSIFVNFGRAHAISTLQRAARQMEQHQKGSRQHDLANAEYQAAFNRLHHMGMRSADILRCVGLDTKFDKGGK